MTNKEAIEILKHYHNGYFGYKIDEVIEAHNLAIRALGESPNQEGDLISREALLKALKSNCKPELCHDYNTAWCESCCRTNDFEDLIDNAPTVHDTINLYPSGEVVIQQTRPQGEWIGHIQYCKQHNLIPTGYELFVWCNRCNCPNEKKTNFCPNCGADMRKDGKQ